MPAQAESQPAERLPQLRLQRPGQERALRPEVRPEWIERTLTSPREVVRQADGRIRYDGSVPEMKNWLRVVVENDQLVTAFLIHSLRKKWGTP